MIPAVMPDVTLPAPAVGGLSRGTVMLMLALNLILLALFILLNAIAIDSAAKMDDAYTSVRRGFSAREQGIGLGDDAADGVTPPWRSVVESDLRGVVHNSLQLSTPAIAADARQVALTIPASAVFLPGKADVLSSGKALVENLTALVHRKDGEVAFRMVVVVQAPDDAAALAGARAVVVRDIMRGQVGAGEALDIPVAVMNGATEDVVITVAPAADVAALNKQLGRITKQVGNAGGVVSASGPATKVQP